MDDTVILFRSIKQLFSDGNFMMIDHYSDGTICLYLQKPDGSIISEITLDNAHARFFHTFYGRYLKDYDLR